MRTTITTDFAILVGLLTLALAIGGAGLSFPILHLVLQISALAVAVYLIATPRNWAFPPRTKVMLALAGAIMLLPLLQLIPMPPGIWSSLPGREFPAEVDAALGTSRWRPLTLDVESTTRAFLALVPPITLFVGTQFLPRKARFKLLGVIVLMAGTSAILGIVQMTSGGRLTPYTSSHEGYPVGLFANRNHQAALLIAAIPIAAAIGAKSALRGRLRLPITVASLSAMLIFAVVAIGTTSRMALIITPLAMLSSLTILLHKRANSPLAISAGIAVTAVLTILSIGGHLRRIFDRFGSHEYLRLDLWGDLKWALDSYGLTGTGFGTFIPVYKSAQSLNAVGPYVINHAHNDILEVLLEGGIVGIALVVVALGTLVAAAASAIRERDKIGGLGTTAAILVAIGILLAASVVDYPLRMPALSCVFAVLCALLMPSPVAGTAAKEIVTPRGRPAGLVRTLSVAATMPILVLSVQSDVSALRLSEGKPAAALRWAPWSTEAYERLATSALVANDLELAARHGNAAVRLSPISAPGLRSVGLTQISHGSVEQGSRLLQLAAVLGWHDPLTQLWSIEAALRTGEPVKASQRAEALFRQGQFVQPAMRLLLRERNWHAVVPFIAESLSENPEWRSRFFENAARLPPNEAARLPALLKMLSSSASPATREEIQPIVDNLLPDQLAIAQQIWMSARGGALLLNGSFDTQDERGAPSLPTSWNIPPHLHSKAAVKKVSGSNDHVLWFSEVSGPSPILSQRLMLPPGSYQLDYRVRARSQAPFALEWEIQCAALKGNARGQQELKPGNRWWAASSRFVIPRQCPTQTLVFAVGPEASDAAIWLDGIRINRLAVNRL